MNKKTRVEMDIHYSQYENPLDTLTDGIERVKKLIAERNIKLEDVTFEINLVRVTIYDESMAMTGRIKIVEEVNKLI